MKITTHVPTGTTSLGNVVIATGGVAAPPDRCDRCQRELAVGERLLCASCVESDISETRGSGGGGDKPGGR